MRRRRSSRSQGGGFPAKATTAVATACRRRRGRTRLIRPAATAFVARCRALSEMFAFTGGLQAARVACVEFANPRSDAEKSVSYVCQRHPFGPVARLAGTTRKSEMFDQATGSSRRYVTNLLRRFL